MRRLLSCGAPGDMRKFHVLILLFLLPHALALADEAPSGYLCIGSEPDWRLDLWANSAQYKYANQPLQKLSGRLSETEASKTWTWRGKSSARQRRDLVAALRSGSCDGAAGRQYPISVALSAPDGKQLRGCCRLPENVAQPVKSKTEMLAGIWLRPTVPAAKDAKQGLNLSSNGKLSLIGIRDTKGAEWRLEGDELLLSTNSERDSPPQVNRLRIEEVSDSVLRLSGTNANLAGTYQREAAGKITGTVTYRQRIELPPEAIVEVKLLDVSVQDIAAKTIGEQAIKHAGQVPVPFEINYIPALIQKGHRYAVQARILDQGKLIFANTQAYPVITMGSPTRVDVVVQPLSR
jgi:putative lipoprotein